MIRANTARTLISAFALVFALGATLVSESGCNKTPPQLSPVGTVAYRVNQVTLGLITLKDVAKQAEAQGLISRADAYTVLDADKAALTAANDLGHALEAGANADTAKAQAIAAIKDALERIPPQLSPHAQQVVAPYIATVITLLSAFE